MAERKSLLRRADMLTAIALVLLGLVMLWKGFDIGSVPAETRPVAEPPVTEVRGPSPSRPSALAPAVAPALKPHGAAHV